MLLDTFDGLKAFLRDSVTFNGTSISLRSRRIFTEQHIDRLAYESVFHEDPAMRSRVRWVILQLCAEDRIFPASLQSFSESRARGDAGGLTVPVLCLPTLTYDLACAVFRAATRQRVGLFSFALSRADLETTGQAFDEYSAVIMGAALRECWQGPVFLQAGPLRIDADRFAVRRAAEMSALKYLLEQALQAGFYNVDLDMSTLTDSTRSGLHGPIPLNCAWTAELTGYIRRIEPRGVTVSIGAALGAAADRNSNEEDLHSFMSGYAKALDDVRYGAKGISKIAVQTQALPSGIPLSDGHILSAHMDLNTLRRLSQLARERYGLSGAVQRGAAELPWESFDRFVAADAAEIHMAGELQDVIVEALHMHSTLPAEMDRYLKREYSAEWPADMSEAHFLHCLRGRVWKAFKKPLWDLPPDTRAAISQSVEAVLGVVFEQCAVVRTRELALEYSGALPAKH